MKRRRSGRAAVPWVIYGVAMALYAATLALTILNGSFSDPFIYFAVAMVAGYTTVGAIVSARRPDNRVGWAVLSVGVFFLLGGFGDEYVRYAYVTSPGSLPLARAVAWLMNWTWNFAGGAILLMVALYPTGRSHARGWRFLPIAIVAVTLTSALNSIVSPGRIDFESPLPITNPTGVDAIPARVIQIGEAAFAAMFALLAVLSVAALVHRYRRSAGDERQQLRLFVYAVTVAALLMLAATTSGALFRNEVVSEASFIAFFAVLGIGVPATIGVALLRYRLLEVDIVVRKTVVYGILAVFLTAAFGIVVAALVGVVGIVADPRGATLTIAAVFAIGALTVPLWRLARRIADRVVFGGRASPYELLATFGERMAGAYSAEDVLPRIAEILGTATGAVRAQVWLRVGRELRVGGIWPEGTTPDRALEMGADALPPFPEGEHATEVRHQGELLGSLTVRMPPSDPMDPSKEKLVRDLSQHAGLVLRNVRLIEELRASRTRLVTAQDEERRRLERNIHDGAQQQLVALAVRLKLAETAVRKNAPEVAGMLEGIRADTTLALDHLRDLARGIYPPLLADKGLAAALEAQARKVAFPVTVRPNGIARYSQEIEAAIYFCVLEALQNAAKYAEPSTAVVSLRRQDGEILFEVADDGRGFDPRSTVRGTGLQNMSDRIEALGGSLEIRSSPGGGTTVTGRVPVSGSDG